MQTPLSEARRETEGWPDADKTPEISAIALVKARVGNRFWFPESEVNSRG